MQYLVFKRTKLQTVNVSFSRWSADAEMYSCSQIIVIVVIITVLRCVIMRDAKKCILTENLERMNNIIFCVVV